MFSARTVAYFWHKEQPAPFSMRFKLLILLAFACLQYWILTSTWMQVSTSPRNGDVIVEVKAWDWPLLRIEPPKTYLAGIAAAEGGRVLEKSPDIPLCARLMPFAQHLCVLACGDIAFYKMVILNRILFDAVAQGWVPPGEAGRVASGFFDIMSADPFGDGINDYVNGFMEKRFGYAHP